MEATIVFTPYPSGIVGRSNHDPTNPLHPPHCSGLPEISVLCLLLISAMRSQSISPLSVVPSTHYRPPGVDGAAFGLNFHRVDAQFIKHIPVADGGLSSHVPAGPEYVTPHIEFLFIAPRFPLKGLLLARWASFRPCLTTTPSPKAPTVGALSLTFGSANTW